LWVNIERKKPEHEVTSMLGNFSAENGRFSKSAFGKTIGCPEAARRNAFKLLRMLGRLRNRAQGAILNAHGLETFLVVAIRLKSGRSFARLGDPEHLAQGARAGIHELSMFSIVRMPIAPHLGLAPRMWAA